MTPAFNPLLLAAALATLAGLPAFAQEPPTSDDDSSSERVEESDEAFRRRMELEDARHRDPGYTPPAASRQKKPEKIDTLPPASRDHIRDQLVDVILENGEWEPMDALEEYPYEPSAAAQADDGLLKREQAAWDEQIEKYHEREAEAFGAQRSAGGAPGSAGGEAGGEAGAEGSAGAPGGQSGRAGSPGGEAGGSGTAGSYSPYTANRSDGEDEPGTAGAQQSALDFLRGRRQQPAAAPAAIAGAVNAAGDESSDEASVQAASAAEADRESELESESKNEAAREIPGIIAIEDLDKLEGTGNDDEPGERDDPAPPG